MKIRLILKPAWPNVVQALGGGPVLVRAGQAGLPRERAVHARPAPRAHGAQRGRPARRRAPPARHRRRCAARLQRGRDELRARPGAGQARCGDGGRARRRRLGDDGLRGPPAEQALRRRAPDRRRAARLLRRRVRAAAARAGALAERRRRRRASAARVQARPPVQRERRSARPRRCRALLVLRHAGGGDVPARLAGSQGRRHAGARGPLALDGDRDRRHRRGLDGRAHASSSTARSASRRRSCPRSSVPRRSRARSRRSS